MLKMEMVKLLKDRIINRKSGIITYGLTPPKESNDIEKVREIAKKQLDRVQRLGVDGLVIYDIQDEIDRNPDDRPFPYIKTVDPLKYSNEYFKSLNIPKIIYHYVGKYTETELKARIGKENGEDKFSVFVGAATRNQSVKTKLSEAYKIKNIENPELFMGGVTIPERHIIGLDEHQRIIGKVNNGCSFFISQAVCNVEASKSFLSDYYYFCRNKNLDMVPIILTLTPCGSKKTLDFMKWLGISIPKWLENELIYSDNILEKSVALLKDIFEELLEFSLEKQIPIGWNIESVSTKKEEIEASVELVKDIKKLIGR
jgi:hypothetical protein